MPLLIILKHLKIEDFVRKSIDGNRLVQDFLYADNQVTLCSSPVNLQNEQFLTIMIETPHAVAESVKVLVRRQEAFLSFLIAVVVSAMTAIIALSLYKNHLIKGQIKSCYCQRKVENA